MYGICSKTVSMFAISQIHNSYTSQCNKTFLVLYYKLQRDMISINKLGLQHNSKLLHAKLTGKYKLFPFV